MTQKAIFITGAATGIGKATAELFASRGYFVGLFDIDGPGLETLASAIGPHHCSAVMDVTRPEDVDRALALFEEKAGGMDVLFNNAGILFMKPFAQMTAAEIEKTVDVNLTALIRLTHAALPLLMRTPGAAVVNMSSASAIYGATELSVYSATKFGVRGITEALNYELGEQGIYVCDVMPTYVRTNMVESQEYQARSLEKGGYDFGPDDIASEVWKAVNGKREEVHWLPTRQLRNFMRLSGLSRLTRALMRRVFA